MKKEVEYIIKYPVNEGAKVKYINITMKNGIIHWESLQRVELIKLLIILKGLLKQTRLNHTSINNSVEQTERILSKIFVEKEPTEDFFVEKIDKKPES